MTQDPLHLLCIEPRFPGRLGGVADWLVRRRGYRAWFLCRQADPPEHWPEAVGGGLDVIQFGVGGVAREPSAAWVRGLERGLCYAYGAWEVLDARRFRPVDLVLGRSAGLGSTLFAPLAYPGVPIAQYVDYYVHPHANDLAGDDEPNLPPEYVHWRRSANAMDLLDLENGVNPWAATDWQRRLFPSEYRDEFLVLHDGIDAARFATDRNGGGHRSRSIAGRSIPGGTKVVTFLARRLERLRGFDHFLTLANRLIAERADVLCIAVGGGPVDRMLDIPMHGRNYGAVALADQPPPDPSRFWTLGHMAPAVVAELLAASDLHVVASRPYPVARSTLEAMASGAVVLALDNEPIREVIDPGRNGLLVPIDDPDAAFRAAMAALDDPAGHRPLGGAAVETIREHYDREVTMPRLADWFTSLVTERHKVRS